jgi:hypothetical protein
MVLSSNEWEYLIKNEYLNEKGIEAYNKQLRKELEELNKELKEIKNYNERLLGRKY